MVSKPIGDDLFVCYMWWFYAEDYSFRGITPDCVPDECRLGIPTKVGLIIADGCMGLRTGQRCVATCTTGLTGVRNGAENMSDLPPTSPKQFQSQHSLNIGT